MVGARDAISPVACHMPLGGLDSRNLRDALLRRRPEAAAAGAVKERDAWDSHRDGCGCGGGGDDRLLGV